MTNYNVFLRAAARRRPLLLLLRMRHVDYLRRARDCNRKYERNKFSHDQPP
jgi:hypothetical protein